MKRFTMMIFICTMFILGTASTALADGIIIPEPPIVCDLCPPPPTSPREIPYLTVQTHQVDVTIKNQIATTHVDQVFRNDSQWSLQGTYIFPIPENATINDFAMTINGERIEGKIYTKEEARRIYDDIVRRRLDPALLEYVGRDLFQASIFPIEPGDTRRVEIEYSQILPVDNGLVQYIYPLSTEKFSAKPLENVAITIKVESKEPLKTIYSSSHEASIDRESRFKATVGWEDKNVLPDKDFSLYYTVSTEDVGVNLLSYKERNEDGFFVLFVAPNVDADSTKVIAKDVILVLDTSGSMEGEKMEQARSALQFVLDHLNQDDRFNIVTFSTGVRTFSTRMETLSALSEAKRFVVGLEPGGSTDINRALMEATSMADKERPTIVIFLTDGLPTSGIVESPVILNNVKQAANDNLRVFPFGVGDDVDTILLDSLAQEIRGVSAYVRPNEKIDEQVSSFYTKVSTPVLANLKLTVEGDVILEERYPDPLPDLFAGSQLIITGRYRQGGPANITLSGQVNGQDQTFHFDDLTFSGDHNPILPRMGSNDFIPRLWATRKIGYLLNQIRLNGNNSEMIDEIVNLSVRYGIITPYTSFLVEEPEMALQEEGRDQLRSGMEKEAAESAAPASGGAAVDKAVTLNSYAQTDMAAPMPTEPMSADGTTNAAVTIVGDKAFVLKEGIWTDTSFDNSRMSSTKIAFPSDDFFSLISSKPELGRYFALGDRVIVVVDEVVYETVVGDPSQLSTPPTIENTPTPEPATIEPTVTPENTPETVTVEPTAKVAKIAANSVSLTMQADVVSGVAPLEVKLTSQLVGGADNNQAYYCVKSGFDFGDGISQENNPSCPTWTESSEIAREFKTQYTYNQPGTYQATFHLGDLTAESVTIVVQPNSKESSLNPTNTPAKITNSSAQTPVSSGSNCLLGLSLPVLGLVIGWSIKPKRNVR